MKWLSGSERGVGAEAGAEAEAGPMAARARSKRQPQRPQHVAWVRWVEASRAMVHPTRQKLKAEYAFVGVLTKRAMSPCSHQCTPVKTEEPLPRGSTTHCPVLPRCASAPPQRALPSTLASSRTGMTTVSKHAAQNAPRGAHHCRALGAGRGPGIPNPASAQGCELPHRAEGDH